MSGTDNAYPLCKCTNATYHNIYSFGWFVIPLIRWAYEMHKIQQLRT